MVFIDRILHSDILSTPFTILSFEEPFGFPVKIKSSAGEIGLQIGGRIDRIDLKEGLVRIIDYKTGSIKDSVGSVSELFEDDRDKDTDGWLQTLVYCESYLAHNPGARVVPSIYKLKRAPGKDLSEKLLIKPDFRLEDYSAVREEFMSDLSDTLEIIFSPGEPFVMTRKSWGKCTWCPYKGLCQR